MGISYNIWSGKRILKYGGEFLAKLSIVRLEFGKQFDLFCLSIVFVNMALLSYWYSLLYWPVQCISDIGGETWRKCLEILSGSLSFFFSQQWLFDKQDLMRERQQDLKILSSEEDYHKILIFFANCKWYIFFFSFCPESQFSTNNCLNEIFMFYKCQYSIRSLT